jgi:hypothetical protein
MIIRINDARMYTEAINRVTKDGTIITVHFIPQKDDTEKDPVYSFNFRNELECEHEYERINDVLLNREPKNQNMEDGKDSYGTPIENGDFVEFVLLPTQHEEFRGKLYQYEDGLIKGWHFCSSIIELKDKNILFEVLK